MLIGIVLSVLITLNGNQYRALEVFLGNSAREKESKEEYSQVLHDELMVMTESLRKINTQIQTHLTSQNEMKAAVQEISAGSQIQSEQITNISENALLTRSKMEDMSSMSLLLSESTSQAAQISANGRKA